MDKHRILNGLRNPIKATKYMNKELNKYLVERWANNCSLSAEEYFININRDLY